MKENCINCQKEVDWEKGDIFYSIYDNFDKYKDKYWCSDCKKEVQKICEGKWGVNQDCIFGENNERVYKHGKGLDRDYMSISICPWCEVQFRWVDHLDHFYHFHGKDKGKCNEAYHKTEEDIKRMENQGPEYKDVRKEIYVEGSPDVNSNDDNTHREREQNWGTTKENWGFRGYCW